MNGYTTVSECPHCNGELKEHITAVSAPAMIVNFANGDLQVMTLVPYMKCEGCGLVIQSPRMTDERLDFYYSSGLYRQSVGMSQEAMDADELRRAKEVGKWIKNGLTPKSHVDIGSSRGYLLQEVGAAVQQGYDRNPNYGKMVTDKQEVPKCDLLTSIHVLEHVPYPVQDLAWYRELCNGYLLIETPGENCKGGPLRFPHLFYFPPDVLVKMLEAAGFEIVHMMTEPNTRILAK